MHLEAEEAIRSFGTLEKTRLQFYQSSHYRTIRQGQEGLWELMHAFKQCLLASPSCSIMAARFSCLWTKTSYMNISKYCSILPFKECHYYPVETISDELMNIFNREPKLFQPLTGNHEGDKYVLKYVYVFVNTSSPNQTPVRKELWRERAQQLSSIKHVGWLAFLEMWWNIFSFLLPFLFSPCPNIYGVTSMRQALHIDRS